MFSDCKQRMGDMVLHDVNAVWVLVRRVVGGPRGVIQPTP
jgi:hypothetical protein